MSIKEILEELPKLTLEERQEIREAYTAFCALGIGRTFQTPS